MNSLYAVARSVLLDALDALNEQRDAIVLVGAQAIYLHTGDADIAVPAFTTDGDLVVEPSRLKDEPRLAEAMERASSRLAASLAAGWQPAKSIQSRRLSLLISWCRKPSPEVVVVPRD